MTANAKLSFCRFTYVAAQCIRCGVIEKELVAASTEPLILSLLAKGESYGYELIQEVKALSGDKIKWTDGMLYPVLHRMENNGWIKVALGGDGKRTQAQILFN